jgi:uncharacterized membrane protein
MADTISHGGAAASSDGDRLVAGLGYVLLGLAPFTMGVTALAAAALAYARKPFAESVARGHYGFQIRTFWFALFFAVVAVAAGLFGIWVLYGDVIWAASDQGANLDHFADPGPAAFKFHPTGVLSLLGGAASLAIAVVWVVVSAVFGLVRLASGHPIRG